jgi:hypothetical protein
MSGVTLTISNLIVGQPVSGSLYSKSSGTEAPTFTISGLTDLESYTTPDDPAGSAVLNFTGIPTGNTFTITRSYSGSPKVWLAQVTQVSFI